MTVIRIGVGPLIREWRQARRMSQLDLAVEAGVSARHLSFVETGRSRPSPELVIALARQLDVPLREQNAMLLAAGYAPRYPRHDLTEPETGPIKETIQRILDAHDPYPGLVVDRYWNVVLSNRAAKNLIDGVPPDLLGPPVNVYRICLHPEGLASRTINLGEWASYLLSQLQRTYSITRDPQIEMLLAEVSAYPSVHQATRPVTPMAEPQLLIPLRLRLDGHELSLFTTITTFGTPQEVTLSELAVELFYPADERTAHVLRG